MKSRGKVRRTINCQRESGDKEAMKGYPNTLCVSGTPDRETAGKRPTAMCDLREKVVQSGLAGKTGKHHVAKAVR